MIITRLHGGLGNQLFQYAVGRHLAEKNRTILKIDKTVFETYKLHKYSLSPFNINENFASVEEIAVLKEKKYCFMRRTIMRMMRKPTCFPAYFVEKNFSFDPAILNLPDNVYIEGYWQSEKYFQDIEEIIRREFAVKTELAGKNLDLAREIKSCNSVSVHIRRGDFISNPEIKRVHGNCCDLDYYNRCAEYLCGIVTLPHFFIFSDDPVWVSENIIMPGSVTYVDYNDADNNYEDLRLMSLCKYHIIANSSFSWWGAWLGTNPNKITIAPNKWFNITERDTKDLIPKEWLKI